jgi:hypothetical protein
MYVSAVSRPICVGIVLDSELYQMSLRQGGGTQRGQEGADAPELTRVHRHHHRRALRHGPRCIPAGGAYSSLRFVSSPISDGIVLVRKKLLLMLLQVVGQGRGHTEGGRRGAEAPELTRAHLTTTIGAPSATGPAASVREGAHTAS